MNEQNGLELFKSLIKDGCEWQGDIFSKKWSECLYMADNTECREHVERTLSMYTEGVDFKRDGISIWIV